MKTKLIAPEGMVIVKVHYAGKINNSTLILPSTFGVQQNFEDFYGEIVSIGAKFIEKLRVGDKVLFRRGEGYKVFDEQGNEFLSLKSKWMEAKIDD